MVAAIEKFVIQKHGIPEKILTDSSLEFENQVLSRVAKKFNFEAIHSSPYHNEGVGCVKRVNQTLIGKLRKMSEFGQINWEILLKETVFATNISYNRSIRTFPYILL